MLHTLTSSPGGAFLKLWARWVFFLKTGIRRKWTFVPLHVTHNINGTTIGVSHPVYTDMPAWKQVDGTLQMHEHRNSSPFFRQSIYPTFPPSSCFISLSNHPFLHLSPSKASSQESAIEFHYSLVMQHFKGGRAAYVCVTLGVCTPAVHLDWDSFFFGLVFCYLQRISSSETQQWCSPAKIYSAVHANCFS